MVAHFIVGMRKVEGFIQAPADKPHKDRRQAYPALRL